VPTITLPIEDVVFVVGALVGGGLLLVSLFVGDAVGGLLDAARVRFEAGGVSLVPPLLAFVASFGVGGIVATQTLDVHGLRAAIVGVGFGALGFGSAFGLLRLFSRADGGRPFALRDLVGMEATVALAIPAGRHGSVYILVDDRTHEIGATAVLDLPAGSLVRVTGVAGAVLIVAPLPPPEGAP
jgi:membrane protein implicated in regulation of membrane protease activity